MVMKVKPWKDRTLQEKITDCERIKADYPEGHPQIKEIDRQIKGYEKRLSKENNVKSVK